MGIDALKLFVFLSKVNFAEYSRKITQYKEMRITLDGRR